MARAFQPQPGGGYMVDLGNGGPPVFMAGPAADSAAAMAYAAPQAVPGPNALPIAPSIEEAVQPGPDNRLAALDSSGMAPLTPADVQTAALAEQRAKLDAVPMGSHEVPVVGALAPQGMTLDNPKYQRAYEQPQAQMQSAAAPQIHARAPTMGPAPYGPRVVGYRQRGEYLPMAKTVAGPAPMSEETELGIKQGVSEQMDAVARGAEAGKEQAAEEYGIRQGYLSQMQTLQTNEAIRQRVAQDEIDSRLKAADAAADDARNAKIDPERLWKNQSKPVAVLAAVLGSLSQSALKKPRNDIMDQLNKQIDDDIAAQRADLLNKRDSAKEAQSLYAQARQRNQDDHSAYLETKNAMLGDMMGRLEAEGARFKGTQLEVGAQATLGRMQEEYNRNRAALEMATTEHVQMKYLPPGPIVAGGPKPQKVDRSLYVPALGGVAPTEKEAIDARKRSEAVTGIKQITGEIRQLRDNPKNLIPGTDGYNQLKSLGSQLKIVSKNAFELGALSGPDSGLIDDAAGDTTSIMPGTDAKLGALEEVQSRSLQNLGRSLGIMPVEQGFEVDAYGRPVPTLQYTGQAPASARAPKLRRRGE